MGFYYPWVLKESTLQDEIRHRGKVWMQKSWYSREQAGYLWGEGLGKRRGGEDTEEG